MHFSRMKRNTCINNIVMRKKKTKNAVTEPMIGVWKISLAWREPSSNN